MFEGKTVKETVETIGALMSAKSPRNATPRQVATYYAQVADAYDAAIAHLSAIPVGERSYTPSGASDLTCDAVRFLRLASGEVKSPRNADYRKAIAAK